MQIVLKAGLRLAQLLNLCNNMNMKIEKIYIGGWFQRTMLHLTEVYNFIKDGESYLRLDKKKLLNYRDGLEIAELRFGTSGFEFIEFQTRNGLTVKIVEDGLIMLSSSVPDADKMQDKIDELAKYYEERLSPAINYLFSLGAPVPKELANIKTVYPYFVVFDNAPGQELQDLLTNIDRQRYFDYNNDNFEVKRGEKYYFVNNKRKSFNQIEKYIEEQIFVREFKGQLHRYLDLHRIIWGKIATVKERASIKGKDIVEFSSHIDDYAKTINLIESRIVQMESYLETRERIAKANVDSKDFLDAIEYRYETLGDTLAYIQGLWEMTKNYVKSAQNLFGDLQQEITQKSLKNLTVITTLGVLVSVINLLTAKAMPQFTVFGLFYFLALAAIIVIVNWILAFVGTKRKYTINDKDYEKIK